jgi:hypothetical protein
MNRRARRFSVLALTILGLIVACAGAGPIVDSPEAREEHARAIVRLQLDTGELEQKLDNGAELASANSLDAIELELGRDLNAQEQERVFGIMRGVLGEFFTEEIWANVLTEVYTAHFTAAELHEVLTFYESPTGRKTLELGEQLSAEIDEKAIMVFESRIDDFTLRVDEELAKAFSELDRGEAP